MGGAKRREMGCLRPSPGVDALIVARPSRLLIACYEIWSPVFVTGRMIKFRPLSCMLFRARRRFVEYERGRDRVRVALS